MFSLSYLALPKATLLVFTSYPVLRNSRQSEVLILQKERGKKPKIERNHQPVNQDEFLEREREVAHQQ